MRPIHFRLTIVAGMPLALILGSSAAHAQDAPAETPDPISRSASARSTGETQRPIDDSDAPSEVDASANEASASDDAPFDVSYPRLGHGLELRTSDGLFRMNVRGRLQVLSTLGVGREDVTGAYMDPTFDVIFRRARLAFTGHLLSEETRYKVELAFSHRDMGFRDGSPTYSPFLDYYLELRQLRELNVRVGQYKVPFNRERVISSSALQMVDRSIVNSEFNLDRDTGITLSSRDLFGLDALRYYAGVYVGEGRDYLPGQGDDDLGFMYIGRVEFLPFGSFEDYRESDHARNTTPRLSLGAGYAFVDDAHGSRGIRGGAPADGGTTDYHLVTADAVFMYGGFSAHTEAIYREGSRNPGDAVDEDGAPVPVEDPRNGVGWFLQMGYLLPETDLEISGRYGVNVPLTQSSMSERNELGLGLSYYFEQHTAKVQLDYFHLWGGMSQIQQGEERVRLSVQAFL